MVTVIDILVSEGATHREWLFNTGEKFTFLTGVASGVLGDEEAKAKWEWI